ncbi:MAG TPA: OmcA/MtrC family decaheme c-type cytochrome [Thermoanaerobaculaceae bacterium]|nr:OmcA/MtrC family decaheme c-type cytochrome [Thermoanaerobaculaceae bacterium]
MALIQCGLVVAAVSAALVPSHPSDLARRVLHGANPPTYATDQAEHYLTADQIAYIRPGLNITVNSVQIGADLKPVVDITFADDAGQPLDRAGVLTPGSLSISFILAWYDPAGRFYTSYYTRVQTSPITHVSTNQANTASGTFEDVGIGHARFHFTTALPANYDTTKTHTLGIYATRNISLTDPIVISKLYVDDVEYDFRPDGNAVTDTWNKMTNATCNQCHDPLAAHGTTGRQDIKLCVLCHNPQTIDPDTGNTVDAKVFIHKIHMGSSLPSVQAGHPYQIIGFGQSVNDFSTVVFPQNIVNCTTCHKADSPQGFVWYTYPSRAACGSCHDNIDWVTGNKHPAGPQPDDAHCADCHQPQGQLEYDASIQGAHINPLKSKQLKGLSMQIMSVSQTAPGQKPVVTFKITNGDGSPVDPRPLGALRFLLGGPTTDYASVVSESAQAKTTFDGTVATYTFQSAIPANATGTWVVSADVERAFDLSRADALPDITGNESPLNPIFYIPVTDAQAMPRRTVVDINKCNVCHDRLGAHGGQRLAAQECAICHNPNGDDSSRRPAAANPPESIQFARLVHRIHTGENLTHDYTIYGFGGSVNTFNDVRFPGDTRDCAKCHADVAAGAKQTYEVPVPDGLLPVTTLRDYYSPMQPTAAACLGCHDSKPAAAHATLNTATFGEACEVCHSADDEFGVARVHAR